MEIPYTVTNRPDTGLYNAKIGIWLFLASEVMLFGGLFSAYVYLRLGADFPWPWHELVIWPGLTNTFVLIASSVTVLLAWVSLKLRQYRAYQVYMAITILCAVAFMCLKSYEYNHKFNHYLIKLKDGSIIDGHDPAHGHGHAAEGHDDHGKAPGFDDIVFEKVSAVTLALKSDQSEHSTDDFLKDLATEGVKFKDAAGTVVDVKKAFIEAKIDAFHDEWKRLNAEKDKVEASFPEYRDLQQQIDSAKKAARNRLSNAKSDGEKAAIEEELKGKLVPLEAALAPMQKAIDEAQAKRDAVPYTVKLAIDPPATFHVKRSHARRGWTKEELVYRDGTKLTGQLKSDKIHLLVSGWDIRQMKGIHEDLKVADHAMIWKYIGEQKPIQQKNAEEAMGNFQKHFGGRFKSDGTPIKPEDRPEVLREGFTSRRSNPDFDLAHSDGVKPMVVEVAQEDIKFYSNYSPRLNTYYSIYFLMTGLHGLHVIGGALVLAYFLFFGRKMYETNPEHLANRVEVGGLFWHFVDLVWIFLFPLYYLL